MNITKQAPKICISNKYAEFAFKAGNRPINTAISKYKKLVASMRKHGWIDSFPATVNIIGGKKYLIDGQNRFTAAKEIGLQVKYVVVKPHYNIAEIASSFRSWTSEDYASSHAAEGNKNYQALLAFSRRHKISASSAASLLTAKSKLMEDAGVTSASVIKDGSFVYTATGAQYAETVMMVCNVLPKAIRKNRSAKAAMGRVLLLETISPELMMSKIQTFPAFVVAKANMADYIAMFEQVYNKHNRHPVPIAMQALALSRS